MLSTSEVGPILALIAPSPLHDKQIPKNRRVLVISIADKWIFRISYVTVNVMQYNLRFHFHLIISVVTIFLKYMYYRCAYKSFLLHKLICIVYLLKYLNNKVTVAFYMCRPSLLTAFWIITIEAGLSQQHQGPPGKAMHWGPYIHNHS
jgi:hypothetical protein